MKKEKYFSPIFTFAATWCQEKKAKKNFHHHQKIYIPSNFFSYFKQQNKEK